MTVRSSVLAVAGALLAVGIIMAGVWLHRGGPVEVAVSAVRPGVVRDTATNTRAGTVKACRRASLFPSTGGEVAALPVKKGERVEAGQVLMEFWNRDRVAGLALARSEVGAAGEKARQSCELAELAQREADRLRHLRESGVVSEEAVDKVESEARSRRAACRAARAAREVSRARLELARGALERTRLVAPFAGVVAEVNAELGEFVIPPPPGAPALPAVDLMDVSCLYVSAPIDEVDAPRIRTGMSAGIALDAFPGRRFDGRVRRIAPYVLDVEKRARTVEVEVEFIRPEEIRDLLPGYSADIEVILEQRDDVLRIPTEALREGGRVLLLGEDGVLRERQVETGLSNWSWTEVVAGLEAGDQVVTSVDREGVVPGARARREER
ncbi:MAG TPA: efflux RND transporter periplasmic adaptor subunit [Gammaproteobacteria bacterium]|nr:efflux RND transporter periplasmic adaptor subunit [Gammaproteobacteria bacterium]